ncbi:hypothetical protein CEXT_709911 [Caerostris extrusa]|uniref:Uncharacterized protein n=1 Tax=Caerostris extrusa TaxID=172846 RepID=A0AAV4TAG8_CAEEX|nr:hypothetical protein CEXT_709911 [Caerostris extrusa]
MDQKNSQQTEKQLSEIRNPGNHGEKQISHQQFHEEETNDGLDVSRRNHLFERENILLNRIFHVLDKYEELMEMQKKHLVLLDFLVRDLSQNILGSCDLSDSSKTVNRTDSSTRLDDSDSSSSMHKSDSFSISPTGSWKNLYHNRGTEDCEVQQIAKNCEPPKPIAHYEPEKYEGNYPTANIQQPSKDNELQQHSEDNYSLTVNPSSSWNKMWIVNSTLECKEQRDAKVYKSVKFMEDRGPRKFTEEYPEGYSQQHTRCKKSQNLEHSVQELHSVKYERYLQSGNDARSLHSKNNVCPLSSKKYAQLSNSERHRSSETLPNKANMLMYDPNLHSENNRGDLRSKNYGLDKPSGSYNRDHPTENYGLHLSSGNYDRHLPSGTYDRYLPSGTYDRDLPPGSYDRDLPSGSYERDLPSGSYDRDLHGKYDRDFPSGNYDGHLPSGNYDGHRPSGKYHRRPDSKKNDCQSNSENCGQNSENFARNMLSVNYDQHLLSQNKQPKRLPKNGFLKSVETNIWSPIRKYFDRS